MITADTNPTPTPATKRPDTSSASPVDATCSATPAPNTPHPRITVARRPTQSPSTPAPSAPQNVPADRIDVISDFSHVWYR